MLYHWPVRVGDETAGWFFNVIIYFYINMEDSNEKTKRCLLMLESCNYVGQITIIVIGVGVIIGIAFLL